MNRGHVIKELSNYLDNQLSEKEKLKVETHLQSCKACSYELERLKVLSQKLKAWQAPGLDVSFDHAVRNEIVAWELKRGQVKMKKKTLAILVPSGVLAGILVFAFLGALGQLYIKRGVQGSLRPSSDNMGKQFNPAGSREAIVSRRYERHPGGTQAAVSGSFGLDKEGYVNYYVRDGKFDMSTVETKFNNGASYGEDQTGRVGTQRISGGVHEELASQTGEGSVIVIQPTLPATGEGEKIIRTGTVKLEVENGKEAYKKASELCQELGGYLASSNFYRDEEGREAGTITMRIPKDKFTTALERLSALGKVDNIFTDSQDISQEYANLKSQLDAAMVVYNKMLEALQKRQVTIPEAMRLESELSPVLRRVADLKNKIEYLNNAVSFTTITVNFHEPKISAKSLKESGRFIRESMLTAAVNTVRFLAIAIPAIILIVLYLGVGIAVVLLVKYWIIRIFKRG